MKSTHTTLIACAKGIAAGCAVVVGTTLLIDLGHSVGNSPMPHGYSQHLPDTAADAGIRSMVTLPARHLSVTTTQTAPIALVAAQF